MCNNKGSFMGIFDRFKNKKNDGCISSEQEDKVKYDMSNPMIKKMVDWIEHPMEFGKKPDSIKIVDKRTLFWPSYSNEDCYLLEYSVEGKKYIGFTGPTTWSFFDIDLTKLSYEDLYLRYTGWFIAFFTINSENYDKSLEGNNEGNVIESLYRTGLTEIKTLQRAYIGEDNYYEFFATKDGRKIKVVGIENDMQEYPIDSILPYYEYIGIAWDPLNI